MPSGDLPLRRPGLTPFVVAASLLHGALAWHRRGVPLLPPPAPPASAVPEGLFELTFERDEPLALRADPGSPGAPGLLAQEGASVAGPRAATPEAPDGGAAEGATRAKVAGSHREKPAEAVPSNGGEAAEAASTAEAGKVAGAAEASKAATATEAGREANPTETGREANPTEAGKAAGAAETPRAIDFSLGRLGAGWGTPAPETTRGRAAPVDPGERASRELRRGQEEHDRELGLGWMGNVLNTLYTTEIRNSAPPGEGTAQIEIEFGPGGQVRGWRVVSGTGGAAGWQKFAELVAAALKRRPPAGLGGARGARAIVEVRMTERFPDGSKPGPSYYNKACNEGRCVGVESDPSNLGAKIIRLMRASLVHAERL
jgi:hypothetical protein